MPAGEKSDWNLVEFARQIAGIPKSAPEAVFNFVEPPLGEKTQWPSAPAKTDNTTSENPPLVSKKPDALPADLLNMGNERVVAPATSDGKQSRRPDEIATMILDALRAIDRCPERGFVVTVYGSNPWNAMLMIRPEAGPGIDRSLWGSRAREIGVRLRDKFDVIQETAAFADGVRHEVADLDRAARRPSNQTESI